MIFASQARRPCDTCRHSCLWALEGGVARRQASWRYVHSAIGCCRCGVAVRSCCCVRGSAVSQLRAANQISRFCSAGAVPPCALFRGRPATATWLRSVLCGYNGVAALQGVQLRLCVLPRPGERPTCVRLAAAIHIHHIHDPRAADASVGTGYAADMRGMARAA